MTLAYLCLVFAMVLPLVFTGLAKSDPKKFDNGRPRAYLAQLDGWRQRAHWVQENSYEIFPGFAASVIVAHLTGTAQATIDMLAVCFVLSRLLYGLAYLADYPRWRSVFWSVGFLIVLGLFLSSYF